MTTEKQLTEEQVSILLHSLGLRKGMEFYEKEKIFNPYRNRFYTSEQTTDFKVIKELIAAGLMIDTGRGCPGQDSRYFIVTEQGVIIAKKITLNSVEKLTRSKKRYRLYLHSESDESFGEWLANHYWDDYRKAYGV